MSPEKPLPLLDAGHVDDVAGGEEGHVELLADRVGGVAVALEPELANDGELGQVLELADLGLGELARLLDAELDGGVAVALGRPEHGSRYSARRTDDAHRDHRPVVLEDLGHADLAADQSNRSSVRPTS